MRLTAMWTNWSRRRSASCCRTSRRSQSSVVSRFPISSGTSRATPTRSLLASASDRVRLVVGRRQTPLDAEALRSRATAFEHVLVDVGTGAGNALLRRARREPQTFFIGVDAVADNMREASDRAHRQPARGGVTNVIFVAAAADARHGALAGIADEVTVVLPW